jgi:hypothetical protein
VLLGELDRGVAGKARMLDRIDPGEDRVVDSFVAMGMGRDLEAQHVRLVGYGLHFLQAELLGADAVAKREDAARRADLYHLGAIFVQPAHLLTRVLGPADHRRRFLVVVRRQSGIVAMAAGGADRIGCGDDPRSLDPAAVDRLLEADIVEV